ncbi:carbohydrate ABC transporter permease [Mycoplasmatota bacterium]|nr:carbohydrate ABC transporter permease [Mycoplasmatota bacterium]
MEKNKNYKIWHIVSKVLIYLFLIALAIFIIIPFYWMIVTALKTKAEVELIPPTLFPKDIAWSNFFSKTKSAFTYNPQARFDIFFKNTIIVAFFSTLGTLITTILAAFAFSRLSFKGRDFLFGALLSTMMIPGEMLIITNFVTVSNFGWINQFQALIIPFMTSVFYIFFLRQTFKQIPDELYYAAKVDGTSDFKYLWRIMIPIGSPTIVTISILNALGSWNAYIWPNLVTNEVSMRLITNGLNTAFSVDGRPARNMQMAASAIVTIPILILFLLLRKQIMRGVSRSGIKG